MKQIIVISSMIVSFFPFLNFNSQNPTSKTFKAVYYEESIVPEGAVVADAGIVNYYRIECPDNPVAYGCGTTGSIPCGASKACPVRTPFRVSPCPGQPGVTQCSATSGEIGCPNPFPCPNVLTYHPCPFDPSIAMCASGAPSGSPCTEPVTCTVPPLAPSEEF